MTLHPYLGRASAQSALLYRALNAGGMGVWAWDLDSGEVFFDETQQALTGLHAAGGPLRATTFLERIHEEDRGTVRAAVDRAVREGSRYDAEFRYARPDGRILWLGGRGDVIEVEGGRCLAGVNWDMTVTREATERAEMVAREMAHRVKNVLALVSGIVRMTARTVEDVDGYQTALLERLHALGAMNDALLPGEAGRRASLSNLVADTLVAVRDDARVRVSVADFTVNERAAQTLVLALNELMTNAIKHGALAADDGTVDVSIEIDRASDGFLFRWEERRGKPITPPGERQGFGTKVLRGLTRSTFRGEPSFEWREDGLRYTCRWRLSEMGEATVSVQATA